MGLDGWLFLQTGSNHVLRLFTDADAYPKELDQGWHDLLRARSDRLKAVGMAYWHVVAPDKLSVFPEFYGRELPLFESAPLRRLARAMQADTGINCLVDPTAVLNRENGALPTYFKTDSHWTIWGAYQAYVMVCAQLGVKSPVDFQSRCVGRYSVCFDLGSKLQPPVNEDHIFWPPSASITRSFANSLVLAREASEQTGQPAPGHHGTHIILHNASPDAVDKIVVLFGDSFCDYRPSSLTYLFAETFREVHFVWSTDIDTAYAERVGAAAVVSEIAERFMTRLPTDQMSVEQTTSDLMQAFEARMAAG